MFIHKELLAFVMGELGYSREKAEKFIEDAVNEAKAKRGELENANCS